MIAFYAMCLVELALGTLLHPCEGARRIYALVKAARRASAKSSRIGRLAVGLPTVRATVRAEGRHLKATGRDGVFLVERLTRGFCSAKKVGNDKVMQPCDSKSSRGAPGAVDHRKTPA